MQAMQAWKERKFPEFPARASSIIRAAGVEGEKVSEFSCPSKQLYRLSGQETSGDHGIFPATRSESNGAVGVEREQISGISCPNKQQHQGCRRGRRADFRIFLPEQAAISVKRAGNEW